MWLKAVSLEGLQLRLEVFKRDHGGDYISTAHYDVPGWYWLEVRHTYFRMGAYDEIAFAYPAAMRVAEIKEEMQQLAEKLREARQTTRE